MTIGWATRAVFASALLLRPGIVASQTIPPSIAAERAEFARWLSDAPTSPFKALAQVPIGPGIVLGPADSDVPLAGIARTELKERDRSVTLTTAGTGRPIARDRATALGNHQLLVSGFPGRSVATLFTPKAKSVVAPTYYPYDPSKRTSVKLAPPTKPVTQRMLAPDGTEVEATEAGTVAVTVNGVATTLRVFRIPGPGGEESDLEIYFRDGTNGKGTYPAGRFVSLIPAAGGQYELDFNRSRNPFCGYSTVYPCPAPWRGNTITTPVAAGERYQGGGLDKPPT